MAFINWNDSYSVKVDRFDSEHKKLVELINTLFDGMTKGHGKDVLGDILNELINYTQVHFTNEEKAMAEKNFPGLAEHKQEHEKLVTEVLDFYQQYKEDRVSVTSDLLDFLSKWLTDHIMGTDQKYSDTLKD